MNTYGDSRDSQMEAEDIEYVMNELKKSEESLRNHSRNKVSSGKSNEKIGNSNINKWMKNIHRIFKVTFQSFARFFFKISSRISL